MKIPIKTGLLAYGMSGKIFHAPFLNVHDGFELKAVVERSVKKAGKDYPGIKSYDSVDDLLADSDIELVVVNTPNATHFEYAMKALLAGKRVLVEKPFTVHSAQAEQLFEEARKRHLFILPYQNRRFDSDFQSVKQVLDSGKLGRVVEVHIRYDRYRDTIDSNVLKETPVPGSGLMYNLCPHLLDAVFAAFGLPLNWKKTLGYIRVNTQVDDYAHIHLSFPNELQVFVTTSYSVVEAQPAFVIHGNKGTYVKQRTDVQEKQLQEGMSPVKPLFGVEEAGRDGILTTITDDGTKLQEKIPAIKSSYLNVFEHIYQTIREGQPYYVSEDQIIRQLEILEE